MLIFCAVSKLTRAAKLSLFWQFLPKLAFIVLIPTFIGLVMMLSVNPVVFWGFFWETLDSKLT
jgi:hypothetical protein